MWIKEERMPTSHSPSIWNSIRTPYCFVFSFFVCAGGIFGIYFWWFFVIGLGMSLGLSFPSTR